MSQNALTTIPLIKGYSPEKILFYSEDETFSQGQFLSDVLYCAAYLNKLDVKALINRCSHRYFFAVIFAAGIVNTGQNLLPQGKQSGHIQRLKETYPNAYSIGLPEDGVDINIIEVLKQNSCAPEQIKLPFIASDTLAALAFTSGSTGLPKANPKYWRTLVGTTQKLVKRFFSQCTETPTIISTVPSQHMYGLEMTVMMALQGECQVSVERPFYPEDIARSVKEAPSHCVLVTTPAHLKSISGIQIDPNEVGMVVSATMPLDLALAENTEKHLRCPIQEIYGCTEAGSIATRYSCKNKAWHLLEGFALQENEYGMLAAGDHLYEEAPLQDVIEILDDCHFQLLGRSTDLINVGGKRSSLVHLTSVLSQLEGVEDAWFFLPDNVDDKTIPRPAAFVVSARPLRDLMKEMSLCVDPVFIPRPIYQVNRILRNDTGKVTRELIELMLKETRA